MQRSAAKRIHRITSWLTSARRCMVHGGKYMYVYINIVSNTIILRSLRTSCTSFLRVVRTVISDASSSPQLGSHSGDTSRAGETLEDVRCCLFVVYLRTPRSAPAQTESLVIFFFIFIIIIIIIFFLLQRVSFGEWCSDRPLCAVPG